jgi:hypothetical protein
MGFTESRTKKLKVRGDLYATTLAEYPYNKNAEKPEGEVDGITANERRMKLR